MSSDDKYKTYSRDDESNDRASHPNRPPPIQTHNIQPPRSPLGRQNPYRQQMDTNHQPTRYGSPQPPPRPSTEANRPSNYGRSLSLNEKQHGRQYLKDDPLDMPPLPIKSETIEKSQPPVTTRELRGWYGYGFASEPYSVVAVSLFIPIILQGLASGAGFQLDHKTPCDAKSACEIGIFGWWIDTSSFPLYVISLSVFVQALLFISLGALADHGNMRKTFLLFFALLGSVASILFVAVISPSLYWLAAILTIVSNVAFGASYVFFYGYVPTLTQYHPDVLEAKKSMDYDKIMSTMERVGNTISTHGFAIGYMAGVFLLICCAALLLMSKEPSLYLMQVGVAIAGAWWLIFSIIPYKFLQPRPGPPLPKGQNYLIFSWKQVFTTISHVRQLSQAFKFLLAWFMLSDGISTLVTIAVMFGKAELQMSDSQLVIGAIIIPFAALIGNYAWLSVQRLFSLTTKQMVILLTFFFLLLPVYGIIGFWAPFGLKHIPEIFATCVYHGLMLGAIQSFCRVMFSELLPKGHENEFFSLYSITDKGSAWIGPLVSGVIADRTHNLRNAFWFLALLLLVPIFILASIDMRLGKQEADDYVKSEKEKRMV